MSDSYGVMGHSTRLILIGCLAIGCLNLSCATRAPMIPDTPRLSETPTECATLLVPMREATRTLRADIPLTTEQQQQWRAWNVSCREPYWQAALTEGLPVPNPVTLPATRSAPLPPAPPATLTWRDYARAALQGFERGATAPVTVCNTLRNAHQGRVGYYTTCNTY